MKRLLLSRVVLLAIIVSGTLLSGSASANPCETLANSSGDDIIANRMILEECGSYARIKQDGNQLALYFSQGIRVSHHYNLETINKLISGITDSKAFNSIALRMEAIIRELKPFAHKGYEDAQQLMYDIHRGSSGFLSFYKGRSSRVPAFERFEKLIDEKKAFYWLEKLFNRSRQKYINDYAYALYRGRGTKEDSYSAIMLYFESLSLLSSSSSSSLNRSSAAFTLNLLTLDIGRKFKPKDSYAGLALAFYKLAHSLDKIHPMYKSEDMFVAGGVIRRYNKEMLISPNTKTLADQHFKKLSIGDNSSAMDVLKEPLAALKMFSPRFAKQIGEKPLVSTSVNVAMSDYQKGMAAYNTGDYATALQTMSVLAKQGHAKARFSLGVMYDNGKGVAENNDKAFELYRKAAKQGVIDATRALPKLMKEMVEEFKAARPGQKDLHELYERDLATGRSLLDTLGYEGGIAAYNRGDYVTAFKNLKPFAQLANVSAQFLVGVMYSNGKGVPQDYTKAVRWTRLAAEQGLSDAQFNLGVLYYNGSGVPQDYSEAGKWIRLAANQGNATAKKALKSLGPKLAQQRKKKTASTASRQTAINTFSNKPINVRFRSSPTRPDDIAVIIGNANYTKQSRDIPNVTPAYADAAGIKRYFMTAKGVRKGNIIQLKDATGSQLVSVFGNERNHKGQLFNWVKPNVSNVYVYYAGHGAPAGNGESSVLVPSDSTSETIELTGYPLATLYKNLGKIPAKSITVILEACFSGQSQKGYLSKRTSGLSLQPRMPTIPTKITVISAGAANQVASWEKNESHSLFTKYFLKGMSGEGDKTPYGNGDGKVTHKELGKYLDGTMTYYARRYYGRDQSAQIVNGMMN
jgi:TPR repeat protein